MSLWEFKGLLTFMKEWLNLKSLQLEICFGMKVEAISARKMQIVQQNCLLQ